MRIGILTFHFSNNVGSALQAFALRKYLISQGQDVKCSVINYEKRGWIPSPNLTKFKLEVYEYLRQMVVYALVIISIKWFTRFQRKHCELTKRVTREELHALDDKYDMFVFGGDQIWCVENRKVDDTYFGDFVKDKQKKISYAPSFGITQLPDGKKEHIKQLLSEYKCISVREKSGQEIVADLLGYNPTIVLDPVFLIGKKSYEELEDSAVKLEGYCLCYIRDKNKGYTMEYAERFAYSQNLKLHTVAGTYLDGRHFPIIGPEAWLKLIKRANLIITNSFHAVCFSIIYHKDFFVDANQKGTRILNILGMLGLEDRLLPIKEETQVRPIDWNRIDAIIQQHREVSESYLKQAIFS